MGTAEISNSGDFRRAFNACFGMSPYLSIHVWDEKDALPSHGTISHLLWALLFLKVYVTETQMW